MSGAAQSPRFSPKLATTLRGYGAAGLFADLGAGLTVAMVALPLSLAIAIASGAAPGAGLVTAIVAGFLISALGGSRVQIGGPTGAFIVVVYATIANHGFDGLLTATLMAGAILTVAGFLNAGALLRHVPEPVIHGFTGGIAIIIAASQLNDLFGFGAEHVPAELMAKLHALWAARAAFNPQAFLLALGCMALIVLLRRLFPRLPGLLLAVVAASAAVPLLGLDVATIGSRFGTIPASLPAPSLPDLSLARLGEMLPSALVIAFLAGIESLLSAVVADRMIGGNTRPNTEIIAQGVANCASAVMGGLPATGAIARTATNVRAGGRTPVAGMAHALFLLAFMLLAAPLAAYLAMPALAAVLLVAAWNMAEIRHWPSRLRQSRADAALMLLTLVLTAFADLTVAIGAGVVAGLALKHLTGRGGSRPWQTPDR
ncbi:MAG: SulP family inorganic anion transporter [Rhizobiaceae bacterium]|jgi:SulP family sulfate permease|nr:SulP family inorganic anion transporter [Rhizobiaceae bacterium]